MLSAFVIGLVASGSQLDMSPALSGAGSNFHQAVARPVIGLPAGPVSSLSQASPLNSLALDGRPPTSIRQVVEKLYAAIPRSQIEVMARRYYGPRAGRERGEDGALRNIIDQAFDRWGFIGNRFPIFPQIACVGPSFSEQVGLQLSFMYVYGINSGGNRFRSEAEFAFSRADAFSRQLFEVCVRNNPVPNS